VDEQEIVLIDILDMLGECTSFFIDDLSASNDLGLAGGTLLMFIVKF
jgi:hypothetical protein